jgi:integrase/recombinase XerD
LTISDYIIAMKREVNPRFTYKRYTIQILSELSKAVGIEKKFIDMTREDILYYLDNCRKSESEDPLHKWIASYNLRLVVLTRFYRWLYYPNIEDPKRRSELSELSPEMTIETDLENKWNNH